MVNTCTATMKLATNSCLVMQKHFSMALIIHYSLDMRNAILCKTHAQLTILTMQKNCRIISASFQQKSMYERIK